MIRLMADEEMAIAAQVCHVPLHGCSIHEVHNDGRNLGAYCHAERAPGSRTLSQELQHLLEIICSHVRASVSFALFSAIVFLMHQHFCFFNLIFNIEALANIYYAKVNHKIHFINLSIPLSTASFIGFCVFFGFMHCCIVVNLSNSICHGTL